MWNGLNGSGMSLRGCDVDAREDDDRWRGMEGKGTTIPKLIRYGRFDVIDNLLN